MLLITTVCAILVSSSAAIPSLSSSSTTSTRPTAEEWKEGAVLFATSANSSVLPTSYDAPLHVTGTIPRWLEGSLYRNGPGMFDVGNATFNGLMDGYGLIFKFSVNGESNSASWRAAFLDTPRYSQMRTSHTMNDQGKIMLGTNPPRKEKITKLLNLGGEVSVNVVNHGDIYLALGEISYVLRFDPETLETIPGKVSGNFFQWNDTLSNLGMGCAHPIKMPDGSLIGKLAIVDVESLATKTDYVVYRVEPNTTTRTEIARVSKLSADMIYAHSFGVTGRYVVLPFWPLRVSKLGAVEHKNLFDSFRWHNESETEFVVIDLEDGTQSTLRADRSFYAMHFLNCYEEEEQQQEDVSNPTNVSIVCDVTAYDDLDLFPSLAVDAFRSGDSFDHTPLSAPLLRLRIPLNDNPNSVVATEWLTVADPTSDNETILTAETPRMNENWRFSKHRYIYAWSSTRPNNLPDVVVAYDVDERSIRTWYPATPSIVGEPVFVPNPNAAADDENDGVVLVAANDVRARTGYVAVLDAKTMTEVARLGVNSSHFPLGFHNLFVARGTK